MDLCSTLKGEFALQESYPDHCGQMPEARYPYLTMSLNPSNQSLLIYKERVSENDVTQANELHNGTSRQSKNVKFIFMRFYCFVSRHCI